MRVTSPVKINSFVDFLKVFKTMMSNFKKSDPISKMRIILVVLVSSVVAAILPQIIRIIFNSLENKSHPAKFLILALISLFVLKTINKILEFLREFVAFKIELVGLRAYYQNLLKAYLHASAGAAQKWQRGETAQRLSSDPSASEGAYLEPLVELGYTFCLVLITVIMGLKLDPLLLMITFVLLAVMFPTLAFISYMQRHSAIQERAAVSGYSNFIADTIDGLREIQQTKSEQSHLKKGFGSIERIMNSELVLFFKLGTLKPGIRLSYVVLESIVFAVGVYKVSNNNLRLGDLLAFLGYLELLASPILYFTVQISSIQKSITATQRIEDTLDVLSPYKNHKNEKTKPNDSSNVLINIRDLEFSYNESDDNLISVSSLDIYRGDFVSIIGANGFGKTTLLNIITGHYLPQKGTIHINGQDVTYVACHERNQKIGYVMQDPYLFSGTVEENFMMSNQNTDVLKEKLSRLGLLDLLEKLPQGIQTNVGRYQRPLSKGETRAVAIARCLANGDEILVLDEPTNGLSSDVRQKFIQNLKAVCFDRTIICSTHDPELIACSNRIIEMKNNADQLLKNGKYTAYEINTKGVGYGIEHQVI